MTIKYIPREKLSRYSSHTRAAHFAHGGVDWGRERWVIARCDDKWLWWVPGSTQWVSIGAQAYRGGSLVAWVDGVGESHSVTRSDITGGRLQGRVAEVMPRIREFFGRPDLPVFNTRKTAVIT